MRFTEDRGMLAAALLGALSDIALHVVFTGIDRPEPGPDQPERGFAPGSRAGADMAGRFTDPTAERAEREEARQADEAFVSGTRWADEAAPAAISEDFAAGMDYARRQFAGQEEDRFRQERALDRHREDTMQHAHFRATCLAMATQSFPSQPADKHVAYASKFYDFICYGALLPNLGCATTEELSRELTARLQDPVSAQPGYRTVD